MENTKAELTGITRPAEQYETVAASQTDQALGATGAAGDILKRLICVVDTADSGSAVSIKDGSGSSIPVIPASAPIGVYVIELGLQSLSGAWSVTTGSHVKVIGIGRFT